MKSEADLCLHEWEWRPICMEMFQTTLSTVIFVRLQAYENLQSHPINCKKKTCALGWCQVLKYGKVQVSHRNGAHDVYSLSRSFVVSPSCKIEGKWKHNNNHSVKSLTICVQLFLFHSGKMWNHNSHSLILFKKSLWLPNQIAIDLAAFEWRMETLLQLPFYLLIVILLHVLMRSCWSLYKCLQGIQKSHHYSTKSKNMKNKVWICLVIIVARNSKVQSFLHSHFFFIHKISIIFLQHDDYSCLLCSQDWFL